jgi:hypothetical protein
VLGQRFDGAGVPLGAEFRVNSYTSGYQRHPKVTGETAGDFVVVWTSDYQHHGVFGQRYDPAGLRIGGEFQINSGYTNYLRTWPAAAPLGAGDFVAVWQDGSSPDVFGQRLTPPDFYDGFEAGDVCAWTFTVGGDPCPP